MDQTPLDMLHSFWCLVRYQKMLHPRTRVTKAARSKESVTAHATINNRNNYSLNEHGSSGRKPGKTADAYPTRFTKLASVYHGLNTRRICKMTAELDASAHDLAISPVVHVILLLYDAILVIILVLYVHTFAVLVAPSMAFCYSRKAMAYLDRGMSPIYEASQGQHLHGRSMQEICLRYIWNLTAAGGFSSAVAGLLAVAHAAAMVCRFEELCYVWTAWIKQRWKSKVAKLQASRDALARLRRDVDIHSRAASRLTMISEEERNTSGENTTRSQGDESQSNEGSVSSGKVEETLLECLLP
jgi:hypothetical protein